MKHAPARTTRLLAALALMAVGALSVTAAHASALSWNWSYSSNSQSGNPSGSGSLTAQLQADGSYLITSLTGTWDQYSITGLIQPNGYQSNDNLLFPSSATTNSNYISNLLLDYSGVSFSVNLGSGVTAGQNDGYQEDDGQSQTERVNLYGTYVPQGNEDSWGTGYRSCSTLSCSYWTPTGTFSISSTTSSVPEPGSFALFAGALGLLAGLTALQRRRNRVSAVESRM